MTTPFIEAPQIVTNQTQQGVTSNEADLIIEAASLGEIMLNFDSDADMTLGSDPTNIPAEWQHAVFIFTDTGSVLTTGRAVIWPDKGRHTFLVKNDTAHTITVKRLVGTGVAIAAGAEAWLRHDGTDIVLLADRIGLVSILVGTGDPTTVPPNVGAFYLDTAAARVWYAVGAAAVSDWIPVKRADDGIQSEAGTARTVSSADRGAVITTVSGSATTITLPEDATEVLPLGFTCAVIQRGAGIVSFAVEGSDVLESTATLDQVSAQHGRVRVTLVDKTGGVNTWHLAGDVV